MGNIIALNNSILCNTVLHYVGHEYHCQIRLIKLFKSLLMYDTSKMTSRLKYNGMWFTSNKSEPMIEIMSCDFLNALSFPFRLSLDILKLTN